MDRTEEAKKVFDKEIEALKCTREILNDTFAGFIQAIIECRGKVILCGWENQATLRKKFLQPWPAWAHLLSIYIRRMRCMVSLAL